MRIQLHPIVGLMMVPFVTALPQLKRATCPTFRDHDELTWSIQDLKIVDVHNVDGFMAFTFVDSTAGVNTSCASIFDADNPASAPCENGNLSFSYNGEYILVQESLTCNG